MPRHTSKLRPQTTADARRQKAQQRQTRRARIEQQAARKPIRPAAATA